jgi:hypothetical protein
VEFEVKQPPRTSLKGSEMSRGSSLPPIETRPAGSPAAFIDPTSEISKSIETLAKQLDQSRSWQEGKALYSQI